MALSLQSAGLVRQKTRAITLDPAVFEILKAFFRRHSSKNNNDLQYIPIADADITGTDGVVAADAACTLYVVYIKKGTTATDAFFKLYDDATNDGTAGNERITLPLLEASESHILVFPQGIPFATGIVATSHTTSNGTTDSTAADAGDGFIIVGADGAN